MSKLSPSEVICLLGEISNLQLIIPISTWTKTRLKWYIQSQKSLVNRDAVIKKFKNSVWYTIGLKKCSMNSGKALSEGRSKRRNQWIPFGGLGGKLLAHFLWKMHTLRKSHCVVIKNLSIRMFIHDCTEAQYLKKRPRDFFFFFGTF